MASKRGKKPLNLGLFKLPVLETSASSTERIKWAKIWHHGVNTANMLLALPFDVFWSKLIDEPDVMLFLDSFLEEFPRFWDADQWNFLLNGDDVGIRSVATEMYRKVLLLLCRATTCKEDNKEISEVLYERSIYDSRIFTIDRLMNIVSLYWDSNKAVVSKILQRTVGVQTNYLKDMTNAVTSYANFFPNAINSVGELLLAANGGDEKYKELVSILSLCNEILYAAPLVVSFGGCSLSLKDACFNFCLSIPSFVDFLEESVVPKIDEYFQSTASGSNGGDASNIVDFVRNSAFCAFHTLIGLQEDEERVLSALQDALVYEKFMFYYNLEFPLESTLSRSSSNDKHLNYLRDALVEICGRQKKIILDRLEKEGILGNLGSPSDAAVSVQIDNLVELLPHFSREFTHLCLRNFGYDFERATNALLDTALLPMDLRALMDTELTAKYTVTKVPSVVSEPKTDEKPKIQEQREETVQDFSRGLISMKPHIKQTSSVGRELNKKDEDDKGMMRIRSEQRLRDMLVELKLQKGEDKLPSLQKPTQQPTTLTKLGTGIEKFYVPDADKVALRPSYEQYRYEEASSPWDDYDDEYDDTMDDHQAYSVDVKANESLPEEELLPGVEPNRNRQIEMENEEGDEIKEAEDQSNRGRGRRARDRHVKAEAKNVVPDQAGQPKDDGDASAETGDPNRAAEKETSRGGFRGRGRVFRNRGGQRDAGYTGGRDRQMKERHKGSDRRRDFDRKHRGGMF